MNDRQIAFIICANNTQYYDECMGYINELDIPQGYEIEVLCIQEAESMAAGYNAGMHDSEAKYKVYLHQDTFILNKNFLHDMIHIFQMDARIGMLGVIGSPYIPSDGECWKSWSIGRVPAYTGLEMLSIDLEQSANEMYKSVQAIDGLIMITQYDIPWREDILDGWDFYDVSQSLEMLRRGYEVVVPYQSSAWCHHDCGASKLRSYDFYKERMFKEYPEFFSGQVDLEVAKIRQEMAVLMDTFRDKLIQMLETGMFREIAMTLNNLLDESLFDTRVREIDVLMSILSLEQKRGISIHSKWFRGSKWEEIVESYREVRLILLRMEYGRQDNRVAWLKDQIKKKEISLEAICILASRNTKDPDKITKLLLE